MIEIVEPSVEVLGHTFLVNQALNPIHGPEPLIEEAGRVCYRSEDRIGEGTYIGFIERIIRRGHTSVIEHASVTMAFVCDRGISHELVRHRLASFSQESTRYCTYGKGIKVIEPPDLDRQVVLQFDDEGGFEHTYSEYELWYTATKCAALAYQRLLKAGVKPEIARSVLPNCLATKIVVTANLREWAHIVDLRTSKFAHPQIRSLILEAEKQLLKIAPTVFGFKA